MIEVNENDQIIIFASEMTLKDYFAGLAMPKLIEDYQNEDRLVGDEDNAERIAQLSYLMADAMMKARNYD
jgi:hypothetical protein